MGIRSRIKNRLKGVVQNIVEKIVEKDVETVGVPQVQKEQPYSSDELEALFAAEESSAAEPVETQEDSEVVLVQENTMVEEQESAKEDHVVQEETHWEPSSFEEKKQEISSVEPQEAVEVQEKNHEEEEGVQKGEEVVSAEEPKTESVVQEHKVSDSLSPVLSDEEKKAQAAQKHLAKTKKGLVQKVASEGGEMSLPDIHSFSEQRYLIGHKKFSDLLEEMIAEELLCFSYDDALVSLGSNAQSLLS